MADGGLRVSTEAVDVLAGLPSHSPYTNLAEVVYRSLAEAITTGQLAPGTRLREIPLSKRFGISTTPVREALRRLQREGLVEVHVNRGAVVAAFDRRTIVNLYEVREVLETRAVRRASEAPDPRDFSRVEAILADMARLRHAPDQVQFNQLDVAFHHALNAIGGNEELTTLAERVHRQIQGVRVRMSVYLPGRPMVSHAEHEAILAAVQSREASRAEELMRAHVLGVREAVIQALASESAAGMV